MADVQDISPGIAEPTTNDHTFYLYQIQVQAQASEPEEGALAQPMDDQTDTLVVLEAKPITPLVIGTPLQIDDEYMTVAGPAPVGDVTETAIVQWTVKATDTDIPLETTPGTVVVGSVFLVDAEYMTVTDVSNADNPAVERGTYGTTPADHIAGAIVSIYAPITDENSISVNRAQDDSTIATHDAGAVVLIGVPLPS